MISTRIARLLNPGAAGRLRGDGASGMAHMMSLQQVLAAFSQAQTEYDVADVLLGKGLATVECERGVLARVDGGRFEVIRAVGYDHDAEARLRALTLHDDDLLTRAAQTGQVLWRPSVHDDRRRFPFMHQLLGGGARRSSVAVPLRHGDETVGALALTFSDSSAFDADGQAFTLLLAQSAADALFRVRAGNAERAARRTLQPLAPLRADILGIVAHDLRNPLNLIEWATEALLTFDTLAPAERVKLLDIARRAAWRMSRLIGDLLDATQLRAGRLSFDVVDVEVRRVVGEAQESLAPLAAESRIQLHFVPPASPCFVRADEGRLLQAIGNLVTNALKVTRAGGSVALTTRPVGDEVVFSVSDNGPGIPSNDQPHLFEAFWQARRGDRSGVGLGLSITRDIVTAMSGRIWVESRVGVGSTFSFALPAPIRTKTAVRD